MVMSGVNNNQQPESSIKTTEIKNDLYSILQSCATNSEKKATKTDIEIVNPAFMNSRLGGGTVV